MNSATNKFGISAIINKEVDYNKHIELMNNDVVTEVQRFHTTIPSYKPTPLVSLKDLAKELGISNIYVKDESHRFGLNAFKGLGGSYAIAKIIAEKLNISDNDFTFDYLMSKEVALKTSKMTFITATDGNHGRGMAWFAKQLGAQAVVLMPKNSVNSRVEAIRGEGAEVTVTDLNYDDAVRLAAKLAEDNGWTIVQDTAWEGYDVVPGWITQGYSTMAKEVVEQLETTNNKIPTHVFLQAGVGSMAGSVLGYFVNRWGANLPKVVIVEPNEAACIYKSAMINDGNPHAVKGDLNTIMAGLSCGEPNIDTWGILRDYSYGFVSCSDQTTEIGMRILAKPIGNDSEIISGESGAVGVGLVNLIMREEELKGIKEKLKLDEKSVVVIFSTEGDTDPEKYSMIINQ